MPGLQYTIGLIDKMSGPAKAASGSVAHLSTELARAKQELSTFQGQLSRAKALGDIQGHRKYTEATQLARRKVYDLTEQAAGAGSGASSFLSSLSLGEVTAFTAAITAMGAAFAGLSTSIVRAANEEQTFVRQTTAAFSAFEGGADAGKKTFEWFDRLSDQLPIADKQLADWTKSLQAAGITDLAQLRRSLMGVASASALVGGEGAETLIGTLRRVQEAVETGHGIKLADRQLASLAKTGINVVDVAAEMGISVNALQQGLKQGTIDAGAFGTAMLDALNKKGRGPLKAMWKDLDVVEAKGLDMGRHLFRNIDITPVTDSLQRMFNLLDLNTASGAELEARLKKGADTIGSAFSSIADSAQIAYLHIDTFALNVETALMPVERAVKRIAKALDTSFEKLAWGAATLGLYEGPNAGPGAKRTPERDRAVQTLYAEAGAIARARVTGGLQGEELQQAADQQAEHLAAGIKQSLISKEEGVYLQGVALGKKAVEGVKKGTDSHSPSRATFRVGGFVGEGLALGMRASIGHVSRAANFLGEGATRASLYVRGGAPARGETGSRAGRGHGVNVERVDVNLMAPQGVTNAAELSAYGLSVALERQQLMGGA